MSEDGLTVLVKLQDMGAAHMVRSLVESHDIGCFVFDDHPSGIGIGIQDIRVMVLASDLKKAQIILKKNNLE